MAETTPVPPVFAVRPFPDPDLPISPLPAGCPQVHVRESSDVTPDASPSSSLIIRLATSVRWTPTSNPSSNPSRPHSAPPRTAHSAAAGTTNPSRRRPRCSQGSSTPKTRCFDSARPSRGAPRRSRKGPAMRRARSFATHQRSNGRQAGCTRRSTTSSVACRTSRDPAQASANGFAARTRIGPRWNARVSSRCTSRCSTRDGTTACSGTATTIPSTWTSIRTRTTTNEEDDETGFGLGLNLDDDTDVVADVFTDPKRHAEAAKLAQRLLQLAREHERDVTQADFEEGDQAGKPQSLRDGGGELGAILRRPREPAARKV